MLLEPEPVQAAQQRVVRPEVRVAQLVEPRAEQPEVQQVVPQEARQVVQQEALPVQQVAQQREAQRQPVVQPQLVESPEP